MRTWLTRVPGWFAIALCLVQTACAHSAHSHAGANSSNPASRIGSTPRPMLTGSPVTSEYPSAHAPATFWSAETGRILVNEITGTGWICSTNRLYIGLANASDGPKLVRMMSDRKTITHVHIDDPTSGHMVYDLDGVFVTGERLPPSVTEPTFTLRFAAISVTGCGKRRLSALLGIEAPGAHSRT